MTIDELWAECEQLSSEIEQQSAAIDEQEQKCLSELETLSIPESVSLSTGTTSANVVLRDASGNIINNYGNYQDGTTLEYNGVTYTYNSKYGAFIKTREPLCTTDNVNKYMIPKSILSSLNANVIVEFCKEGIYDDEQMVNLFPSSYNNKDNYFSTSKDGELPISRIYNINHGVNKIQFELNQYWTGNKEALGEAFGDNKYNTCINGCMLFSLINSVNVIDAKEEYNSQETVNFLRNNVERVIAPIKEKKINVRINDIEKLNEIARAANIDMNYDGSRAKGDTLNNQSVYIVRTDKLKTGQLKTTGGHYVLLVPSGDGNCYVIDSNNSIARNRSRNYDPYYIPYMSYEEAKISLHPKSGNGHIAWEVERS